MTDPTYPKAPVRGPLPPSVEQAARMIHREVWTGPYKPGEGPMHYAGGPYWGKELRRLADRWVRLAAAARIAAEWLPDEDCDLAAPPRKEHD